MDDRNINDVVESETRCILCSGELIAACGSLEYVVIEELRFDQDMGKSLQNHAHTGLSRASQVTYILL